MSDLCCFGVTPFTQGLNHLCAAWPQVARQLKQTDITHICLTGLMRFIQKKKKKIDSLKAAEEEKNKTKKGITSHCCEAARHDEGCSKCSCGRPKLTQIHSACNNAANALISCHWWDILWINIRILVGEICWWRLKSYMFCNRAFFVCLFVSLFSEINQPKQN